MQNVIVLELNEINPQLLRNLLDAGLLPNLERLANEGAMRSTRAEEAYEKLEPWIQWVTVHTGLRQRDHGSYNLSDGQHIAREQIWDALSDAGVACGIVSPMNGRRGRIEEGFYVPDPWSSSEDFHPAALAPIYRFLRERVNSHNIDLDRGSSKLAFAVNALRAGVPVGALLRLAAAYVGTRFNRKRKWRLAAEFDLFLAELTLALRRRHGTRYTSVFMNSVAHYQHHYWTRHDPKFWSVRFPVLFGKSNPLEVKNLEPGDDPVRFGMETFDRIVGKVQEQCRDAKIFVLTGLSQVPFEGYEGGRGFYLYRPYDHERLLRALGIAYKRALPLMSRDMMVYFHDESARAAALKILGAARVGDEPLFSWTVESDVRLFVKIAYSFAASPRTRITVSGTDASFPFEDYLQLITFKTGHHAPKGVVIGPREVLQEWRSDVPIPLERIRGLIEATVLDRPPVRRHASPELQVQ